jgi:RNA polymerase sigma-70 factor (ECF subfamily)
VSGDFSDFYRERFGELAAYAWRLTRDANRSEDLAQEAMTRVCARWPVLAEPRPYAYRVVTNLVRDAWKAQMRLPSTTTDRLDAVPTAGPDTSTLDAVRRLPPPLRDVVVLHYYADLPVSEVARTLRRPVGTIKRRLHEARAALAVALTEEVR